MDEKIFLVEEIKDINLEIGAEIWRSNAALENVIMKVF